MPSAPTSTASFAAAHRARPTSSTRSATPHAADGRAARRAAGVRRAAVEQAVLPLRRRDWLEGDPGQPPPPAARKQGRNARLGAPLQPRRHLDAGQVGVSVVRRVGPRVPHGPVRADRPALRQGAAPPAAARVVHAPERADARLRVRVRRREPAGARVGRAGASTRSTGDRRATRDRALPRARVSRSCCSTSPGGSTARTPRARTSSPAGSSASTTSASSTAPSRCPTGGHLEQADGTAWMAFYCATMLSMALELASDDPAYEDSPRSSSSTSSPSPTR